ncbi:cyclohexanone monooxygenase [Pseudomonas sp. RIT-PI-q]|uniref:flavin-containing monooxygenase n=1 Tax=Pseudomonas sp. RIT-PI-q TaxID=1690247 RepID=UPI0006CE0519|nr:NAD(P)/FAD-dependent oxidoreductase [Pseudomonas sp. RIT-PI-q]KPH01508.1 cyclohexanone monooxygenase [Pseudomonas sp. RIT-PI-q]
MERIDAIVVGAGFSGLYMLHRLREEGLSTRVFELGDDVGGVWYWNRYPGAKCDIESVYYNYTFSPELLQEWTWENRYPDQPAILKYLNHVADRFDLRRDIQFKTRVTSAHYDQKSKRWLVQTDDGKTVSAKYFISGVGCLSSSNTPKFKGLDSFQGECFHTGSWPHEPVDFKGKRVGVIGTGSSGIQAIPVIAKQAQHLYVFQRTPQYTIPAGNRPYDEAFIRDTKANYGAIKQQMLQSWSGTPKKPPERSALDATEQERRSAYEAVWQDGGQLLSAFKDLMTNLDANATAGQFIRDKIGEIVRDPAVAKALTPSYVYGTKRPVLDTGYYETFNRDNVTLVDVKSAPVVEITANGLRTTEGDYEFDALVFATGYDVVTGPLFRLDVRGKEGVALKDKWANGSSIQTYLGIATSGFPNFFMITGPQSPALLSNNAISIEQHVEWITDCIRYLREHKLESIESNVEAEQAWSKHCKEVSDATLFSQGESYWTGANIEGKHMTFPVYVAGVGVYRGICDKVQANGYEGFSLTPYPANANAEAVQA